MFTGIVEETGEVLGFHRGEQAWRLEVGARLALRDAALGDSIAVNGCCLTIAAFDARRLSFDVLEETKRLTNFSAVEVGGRVNLERSVRLGDKMGGHFMTGHIDGLGKVHSLERRGQDTRLQVHVPGGFERYLIYKGSIAINGVSLTVAEVVADTFTVWLIPTTLAVTNLGELVAGSAVNLEFDLLGKYVEKLLSVRQS